jgi:hypothetical protein
MPQLGLAAAVMVEAGAASVVVVTSVVVTASVAVDAVFVNVVAGPLVVISTLVTGVVVEVLQGEATERGESAPLRAIRSTDLTTVVKSGSKVIVFS